MIRPFPWRPGMVATVRYGGARVVVVDVDNDAAALCSWVCKTTRIRKPRSSWMALDLLAPVETDGATLGALRQVLRELRGDPSWSPTPLEHDLGVVEWVIDPPSRERQTLYPSEFAAMMAAYERIT